ncbi:MAG: hypothetical protein R3C14_01230 [Caldilineaceae bacterium]
MKFQDLTAPARNKINGNDFDRIVEKHEGPESWSSFVRFYDLEFLEIDQRAVLLPVDRERHPNITVLRSVIDAAATTMTIFLKDTTYASDPEMEMFETGFVTICEKVPGEAFFIAVVYHEWFILATSQ